MSNVAERGNAFDVCKLDNGEVLVQVKVKDFCGQFTYCIEDCVLREYINDLEKFDCEEQGKFKLADMDSESYIDFEKTKHGHMKISGQLGSNFRKNYLAFEMNADQTMISELIEKLK